ncbi:MAG: glycosyltransferase [Lachnospiraceae bacterium]
MKELISIIVPVYRAADYIAEAVAMVQVQTWQAWELLLVEDCSPDNSVEVIRSTLQREMESLSSGGRRRELESRERPGIRLIEIYTGAGGQRITLICKEKNEGAARARNTGLSMAQGRYIAFLDADDVWHIDKLEKEMRFLQDRQAGFVFTAYEFGDEQARPTGKVVHVPAELTYRQALSRTVIFTTTVLFDRKKIPDGLLHMPVVESEDTATWWQILREGYTAYGLDEVLAVYRRPAQSLSSNKITAVRRIWNLYRRQEKLSVAASAWYFVMWAYRATMRRL